MKRITVSTVHHDNAASKTRIGRIGFGGAHTEGGLPFSGILRRMASNLPPEPKPESKPVKRTKNRSGLSDEQIREIRRLREIEGLKPKAIWALWQHILPNRDYLTKILSYHVAAYIVPDYRGRK